MLWEIEGYEERSALAILIKIITTVAHSSARHRIFYIRGLAVDEFRLADSLLGLRGCKADFRQSLRFLPQAGAICFLAVSVASMASLVVAMGQE